MTTVSTFEPAGAATSEILHREGTPPCAVPPPIPMSTPIKKEKSPYSLFSTLTRYRHPTLHIIGNHVIGHIVGPMPTDNFLDTFLPQHRIPRYHRVANFLPSVSFQRTATADGELHMYKPFIQEMQPFAPQLHFADSHARGDKDNGYSFEIKPDISVYHRSVIGPSSPERCSISDVDLLVEFKWNDFDDPFILPSGTISLDDTEFIGGTSAHRDTIGQVAAYAAAQLISQFRTHAFSVFVLRDTARIIRWDREGAVVTEPIPYNFDPSLAEFFSRYSMAPSELRGFDATVTMAYGDEAARACKSLGLAADTCMFKTSVPATEDGLPMRIIFAKPAPHPHLPMGRATRACPAYDIARDRVVFLKESWRICAPDVTSEGQIYKCLNQSRVRFVPTCLASGDVESWGEQTPQTYRMSQCDWACKKNLRITRHNHHRLLLDIVGSSLTEFRCSKEMVQAIHDALLAHMDAFNAGYVHRDISPGNIITFGGHGYLIDWDLAKSCMQPRQTTRTGTWQFVSARLVEDATMHHTFQDDLESAFWVLLWMAVIYSPSAFDIDSRSSFVRRTFESDPGAGEKRGVFLSRKILETSLFPDHPTLVLLIQELIGLFRGFYLRPTEGELATYLKYLELESQDHGVPNDLLRMIPAFGHLESVDRLKTHDYVISCFARHLEADWPSEDRAVAQPLNGIDRWGLEDGEVVLKSKHLLSRVGEEDGCRKKSKIG